MYSGQISTINSGEKSGRVFLDILRFVLATVVVLGHVTQPVFQKTLPDLTRFSIIAVGGFFILSGYTIRAITKDVGRVDPLHFLAGRASRLLSVSLYALVLTVVCDALSSKISPDFYSVNFGEDTDKPLWRIIVNVFFLSQLWGMDVSPFSNSPFWSLSYEAAFYVIWAAYIAARRGAGWCYVGLAALLYGPNILFMFLFWLLGSLSHDIEHLRGRLSWLVPVFLVAFVVCVGGAIYLGAGGAQIFRLNQAVVAAVGEIFAFIHVGPARVQVNLMIGAVAFFVILVPVLALARLVDRSFVLPKWVVRAANFLGGLTFPMYLIHFPLLVLTYVCGIYDPSSVPQGLVFVCVLMGISHICVVGSDTFKKWLRENLVAGVDRLRGQLA